MEGGFYENMLSPIQGDQYKVKIHKTRKRLGRTQYFVSYLGFGPSHNEWVDGSALTQLGVTSTPQEEEEAIEGLQQPERRQRQALVDNEVGEQQQQLAKRRRLT